MRFSPYIVAAAAVFFTQGCGDSITWKNFLAPFSYPTRLDLFEEDNTTQNATILKVGEPQRHSIYPVGEEDWTRVSLVGGVAYEFTATQLSVNADTMLHLYDTDGETILAENDDCIGYDSCFSYTPAADGDYYLMVDGYNRQGVMSYMLDVHPFVDADGDFWSSFHDCNDNDPSIHPRAAEISGDGIDQSCVGLDAPLASSPDAAEPDNTPATATNLVMAKGMQITYTERGEFFPEAFHTFHDNLDVDWFRVEVGPHQVVGIESSTYWWFDSDMTGGISLELENTDLNVLQQYQGNYMLSNDSDVAKTALIKASPSYSTPCSYLIFAVSNGYDRDMDGYGTMGMWYEHDCNDSDPSINNGAGEIWDDGIDQDCDGLDSVTGRAAPPKDLPPKRRR